VNARVFPHPPFPGHALLDSGGAEKLERFGEVVLRRPDPQAFWSKRLAESEWKRADLTFVRESDRGGRWEARPGAHAAALAKSPAWTVRFGQGLFEIQPTPFKHVGLFPEQATNWTLVSSLARSFGVERPRLLNLFAYTGAASVLAAQAGYEVTHVDASKASIAWAKRNVALSDLPGDALRILLDDGLAFARREVRRGARYHVVLLDPPSFGRGPKGEKWEFEEGIAPLVEAVKRIVAEQALVVLSTYAIGCSPLTFENLLAELGEGAIGSGELALPEEGGARLLPCGFCARWSRGIPTPNR
jgi:23S rRNA (cytosine1962-C5)-methyltransferase